MYLQFMFVQYVLGGSRAITHRLQEYRPVIVCTVVKSLQLFMTKDPPQCCARTSALLAVVNYEADFASRPHGRFYVPPDDPISSPCTPFIRYTPHIIDAFLLIKILFLGDIHTKSWYGLQILSGFRCAFSCMFQYCLCHGMHIFRIYLYRVKHSAIKLFYHAAL